MKPIFAANLQIKVRTEMKRLTELHNSDDLSLLSCKSFWPNMEITAVTHALARTSGQRAATIQSFSRQLTWSLWYVDRGKGFSLAWFFEGSLKNKQNELTTLEIKKSVVAQHTSASHFQNPLSLNDRQADTLEAEPFFHTQTFFSALCSPMNRWKKPDWGAGKLGSVIGKIQ